MTTDNCLIPRSEEYRDKCIIDTGYILICGDYYYKRLFSDGCVELVRYDKNLKKWMMQLFCKG